jgi:hypothetical protein
LSPPFDGPTFLIALDDLVTRLCARHRTLRVRRIGPEENPSGDDWIWYFSHPTSAATVQVDPGLESLFFVSADPRRGLAEPDSVDAAVELVERWLGLPDAS